MWTKHRTNHFLFKLLTVLWGFYKDWPPSRILTLKFLSTAFWNIPWQPRLTPSLQFLQTQACFFSMSVYKTWQWDQCADHEFYMQLLSRPIKRWAASGVVISVSFNNSFNHTAPLLFKSQKHHRNQSLGSFVADLISLLISQVCPALQEQGSRLSSRWWARCWRHVDINFQCWLLTHPPALQEVTSGKLLWDL